MKWLMYLVVIFLAGMLIRRRYRVINRLLSNRWIRKWGVSMVMRIPAVRERMIYETFR
ncbi:sodium:proton antiporter [Salipaludibacillus sp. CUR1]|uniref:sodium:proton antiporter n=1 Tax=Salipaludibacillus sp. CUR1 TaxID=2820003 RepID=UPI001E2B1B41|nr:sodium:proton antiporter [Salipaludibacillus sp. CUR1]MCE7794272.1 sodium:proton antiporter [Salipaludibacillus sp. CUR1]